MDNKFIVDIDSVIKKFEAELSPEEYAKIQKIREDLIDKYNKRQVKINHSVMELICAKFLIKNGFNVDIEHELNTISTDIYAKKGFGSLIVEVETGFVPPDHALDPLMYLRARVASKITRYSAYANKFILATTPYYIMQVPSSLIKPPRFRTPEEVEYLKKLCDMYYSNPPVSLEEIRNARLHSIYVVDVDDTSIREWEVNEYMGKAALWAV
ncbi:MAG: hypothetical protein V1710_01285 [Candidatus Bathyarchaeota archaeon]